MKKLILVALAMFSLVDCNQAKNKKTDLEKANLKGKVMLVNEMHYDAVEKNGEVEKIFPEKERNVLEKISFYNKKGKECENISFNILVWRYIWGDYYRIMKSDIKANEVILSNKHKKIVFKYDDGVNPIGLALYDSNGDLKDKEIYKYDDRDNQVFALYDSNGNLSYKLIYKYDNRGNQIERTMYYSNGNLCSKITYKYDDRDNLIERVDYNLYGDLDVKITYKYDDRGNKIEEANYNSNGDLSYKLIYKYDNRGNQIEELKYDKSGDLSSKYIYKYKYDNHDNWIERISYENEKPIKIVERQIVYYE